MHSEGPILANTSGEPPDRLATSPIHLHSPTEHTTTLKDIWGFTRYIGRQGPTNKNKVMAVFRVAIIMIVKLIDVIPTMEDLRGSWGLQEAVALALDFGRTALSKPLELKNRQRIAPHDSLNPRP